MISNYRNRVNAILALLIAVFALAALACGSDDGGVASAGGGRSVSAIGQNVIDNGRTYTIDDIKVAGAKASKEYDVTDLPGAIDAWKVLFDRKAFEARFYPDHATAVQQGAEWARFASGPDAVVVGDGVRWQEGRGDRRQCNRAAETPHSSCSYTARYGDFVILGNLVLMCEGANSEEALKTCKDLTQNFQ